MKMHIEYDDFGEYLEVLEDFSADEVTRTADAGGVLQVKVVQKIMIVVAAFVVMFCTSSYAA